jgi:hypothetical protein
MLEKNSPLAQLARASGLHPEGRRFESYRDYIIGPFVYRLGR